MARRAAASVVSDAKTRVLTRTWDIIGDWKEHFEEFLNLTNASSVFEAEFGDSGEHSPISLAEVILRYSRSSSAAWCWMKLFGEIQPWKTIVCILMEALHISHEFCKSTPRGKGTHTYGQFQFHFLMKPKRLRPIEAWNQMGILCSVYRACLINFHMTFSTQIHMFLCLNIKVAGGRI